MRDAFSNHHSLWQQLRAGTRAVVTAVTMLMLAGGAEASAADTASDIIGNQLNAVRSGDPGVPAGVPDGYVITPNGYFHPSCVRRIAPGETLDMASGEISRAGTVARRQPACAYPRFDAGGLRHDTAASLSMHPPAEVADDGSAPSSTIRPGDTLFVSTFERFTGWIESAYGIAPVDRSLAQMTTRMQVPTSPVNNPPLGSVRPTNFFFPGAQNLYQGLDFSTIIQPVLGWNSYGDYNGWTIASWNCCIDGNTNASDRVVVAAGDVIEGVMTGSNCSATTGICANWAVETRDVTSGGSTTLDSVGYGQAFNWIFGGVLEVYNVGSCDDHPRSGSIAFDTTVLKNVAGGSMTTLGWTAGEPNSAVACGYGVEHPAAGPGTIRLRF